MALTRYGNIRYGQYTNTVEVDPTTLGTPAAGTVFEGVFNKLRWTKDESDNVTWEDNTPGGLVQITEGGNDGYALSGDDRTAKGDIGVNTVDLNKNASHAGNYIDQLNYAYGLNLEPLDTAPGYDEGNFWYDSKKKTFAFHNEVPDIELNLGETWIRVINETASTIQNGKIVRAIGSDPITALPSIVEGLADTYLTAYVMGMTTHAIVAGGIGYVTTLGDVVDVDTSHIDAGAIAFLSDTDPGDFVQTPPSIATLIGRVTISGVAGKVLVNTENLINFPGALGILQQLENPAKILTAGIAAELTNYIDSWDLTMIADPVTGTIQVPATSGFYNVVITAQISFTSETQTRTLSLEIYNQTAALSLFQFVYNVPRDAVSSSMSFTYPFNDTQDSRYVVRVIAENSETISFDKISFSIESMHLRY